MALILTTFLLSGCASPTMAKIAGTAVSVALESGGLAKKEEQEEELTYHVPLRIQAGDRLNLSADGKPLSVVIRIYHLAAAEAFERMTYAQANTPEDEKALLADDVLTAREVVLIPGRSYDLPQALQSRARAIGIIGQFRAPAAGLWKLTFDARASRQHGITVGALACSLAVGTGTLMNKATADSARPLVSTRCNG